MIDADRQSGQGTPIVDATGSQTAGITINGGLVSLTAGSTQPMLISGYNGTNLSGLHVSSGNLGNTPWFNAGQYDIQVNNQPFAIYGTGHFTYAMPTPTTPTSCVVSAGGAVPLGQHTYSLTAVDADNNETLLGPAAVVTTTTGNQTVTCNLPARANGASGFNLYRDSFKANPSGGVCSTVQLTGGSFTDSLSFGCGASNPSVNSAGSTSLPPTNFASVPAQPV